MDVGSSSHPHTSMGRPEGGMGEPLVSEPCPARASSAPHTFVPPPGAVAPKQGMPQQILPGYGSGDQDFWTKGCEAGGVWDPALDTWCHVPEPQRHILRGTWKNVPSSGKGDTGN